MGVYDEHWCSECRKALDKRTDTYHEFSVTNPDEDALREQGEHARSYLCEDCYAKLPEETRKALSELRRHGNPTFSLTLRCNAAPECADHEPLPAEEGGHCRFIYANGCQLYCGRRHPGAVDVGVDQVMVDRQQMEVMAGYFQRLAADCGAEGVDLAALGARAMGLKTPVTAEGIFATPVPEMIIAKPVPRSTS